MCLGSLDQLLNMFGLQQVLPRLILVYGRLAGWSFLFNKQDIVVILLASIMHRYENKGSEDPSNF